MDFVDFMLVKLGLILFGALLYGIYLGITGR